jgi:hypothetical protein
MNVAKYYNNFFDESVKQQLFNMYEISYSKTGKPRWFKNKEDLFKKYPCLLTIDNKYQDFYIMYQFNKKFNKISLVCHNNTDENKSKLIELLNVLLRTPGYILEASGAVSWVLRKTDTPMILEKKKIEMALDIDDNSKNDKIVMNESFNISDKNSQCYTRIFTDSNSNVYTTDHTLFGSSSCEYNDSRTNCDRECVVSTGGNIKQKKTKNKKNIRRRSLRFYKRIKYQPLQR